MHPQSKVRDSLIIMSKITDSARGMECQMLLPGICVGGTETTVWAHSNSYSDGKGRSLKAHDHCGAYACYQCHAVYDRQMTRPAGMTHEMVELLFTKAMRLSQSILVRLKLWDGVSIPERARSKPAKSRKIPVTGLSALQRMAVNTESKVNGN